MAFITIGFQLLVFQLIPKPIPFGKSVRRVSVDRCFTGRNFNVPSTVVALTHQKNQFTEAESVKTLVMFLGCSQPLDLLMKTIFRGSNLSLINKWAWKKRFSHFKKSLFRVLTTWRYISNDQTLSPRCPAWNESLRTFYFPDKSVYITRTTDIEAVYSTGRPLCL